jgi:hypothetical protein
MIQVKAEIAVNKMRIVRLGSLFDGGIARGWSRFFMFWAIRRSSTRSKYDAARNLTDFSVSVLDEVDLSDITNQLLSVADETMKPASMSLWLRVPRAPISGATTTAEMSGNDD